MRQLESPAGRQAGLGSEARRHRHGDDRADASDNPPLLFRRQRAGRHAHLQSSDLQPGFKIIGPAIVEEPTTTLVVFPQTSTTVSGAGNYIFGIG